MVGRALAVTALVLLVGCGPVHPLAASSAPAGTIPWLPLPADLTPFPQPSPVAAPVPAGTPPCTASELAGVALGSQGATGHVIASFAFAGTGNNDCYLEGTPNVTVFDGSGKALSLVERAPFFPPQVTGPQLVSPGPLPQPHDAVKYGEASLTIDWDSQPEPCPGQAGVTLAQALIPIPGGGTLTLALPPSPQAYACQGLGVDNFESPPVAEDPAPIPDFPTVGLTIPGPAAAGKSFDYLVTLTNGTTQPMDLAARCPNYEEEMFPANGDGIALGGKHLYRLNCAAAGTLTPGASAVFQMVFDVPAGASPGDYILVFGMSYWYAVTNAAKVQVTVVKG